MEKTGKIMLLIWVILALISFVSSFWAPLYFKIIGLIFGGVNVIVILTWIISYFILKFQHKKLQKEIEESNKELDKELEE